MPTIRANTIIAYSTGLPKDVISNTMWFEASNSEPFQDNCDAIAADLETFYGAVYALGWPSYLANTNRITTNFYDMSQPKPRVPYTVPLSTSGWGTASSTPVPTEVAAVLSYHAEPTPGIPPGRLRGRIYIGGLTTTMMQAGTGVAPNVFPQLSSAFITDVRDAAAALRTARGGADGRWSVYSPTAGASFPVWAGWVDNTPDTQRRRGVESTSRTLWP